MIRAAEIAGSLALGLALAEEDEADFVLAAALVLLLFVLSVTP